ncbi:LysR family transcriptional regulator [Jannaschia rubra]|uniref:Cyn operon transcriptional activator n=1 Tax=Jannaschia rubra TaxID=282197 RepID=A0A0M6XUT1_9RHOB|nr:LysR family transcriptional regulator [Jannaschia rubra]CTQ34357.1 Cyn operon transcriptional activator [Jannaschia rubra]SFG62954.1 DNA-binding transcriptional regulator, LysR family [Jannaschia rubra]
MIGNAFTLKQIEALVTVADLGGFRRAAEHLNTTQPNISSRIAGLEETLGHVLMLRDAGSVRMTARGEAVLAAARRILAEAETLIDVAERPDLVEGRLRLGVTELVACTWLHRYLRALKDGWPSLSVELTVDLSRVLDRDLAAGALDLTIQTAPFATDTTGVIDLGQAPYVWLAAPSAAAGLPDRPDLISLAAEPILTHARHTEAFAQLSAQAAKLGVPAARLVPSSSMASCLQMVVDGLGVALLPQPIAARHIAAGELVALDTGWLPAPLSLAARFHEGRAAPHVAQAARLALTMVG